MGRPGIRCVAIYWKQLCLTLNLFFLSCPIYVKLLECQREKPKWLSVFLWTSARPNSDKRHDLAKHFLKIYRSSILHTYRHVILRSLIPNFLGRIATTFSKHLLQMQTFSQNFNPEDLVEVPQVGDGISGPASEAPGHCCPWNPARRLSRARLAQPGLGPGSPPRGAAFHLRHRRPLWLRRSTAKRPRPLGTKVVDSWALYPFNKRTMNVLDWTSSKCSKQNIITNNHKISQHTEQVSLHVVYNIAFNRTFCNSFSKNW